MHNHNDTHPLLRQVPLTIPPNVHIPSAVTLPYTFRSLPLSLPPPSTQQGGYIKSPSGQVAATPESLAQNAHALLQHLKRQKQEAEKDLKDWEASIRDRELAEKRRVAPGYLDTGIEMLLPIRRETGGEAKDKEGGKEEGEGQAAAAAAGEELDRVFGKMGL